MQSWIVSFLKPFLIEIIQGFNTALIANKADILSDVGALATKDAPTIAKTIEAYIPNTGFLGSLAKPLIVEYVATAIGGLSVDITSEGGTWFDDLVAALEREEKALGLLPSSV